MSLHGHLLDLLRSPGCIKVFMLCNPSFTRHSLQVNVKGLFFYIFVGIPNYKFIHIDVEICTWYIGSLVLTKYLILIVKAGFISIKKIINKWLYSKCYSSEKYNSVSCRSWGRLQGGGEMSWTTESGIRWTQKVGKAFPAQTLGWMRLRGFELCRLDPKSE